MSTSAQGPSQHQGVFHGVFVVARTPAVLAKAGGSIEVNGRLVARPDLEECGPRPLPAPSRKRQTQEPSAESLAAPAGRHRETQHLHLVRDDAKGAIGHDPSARIGGRGERPHDPHPRKLGPDLALEGAPAPGSRARSLEIGEGPTILEARLLCEEASQAEALRMSAPRT